MINGDELILIKRYLSGDEKSFEVLVSAYLRPIYSFIYRYIGNAGDAEDMTQDVFVKAWRNLKKFDRSKNFKTWIFSIAKNSCFDFLKKSQSVFGGRKTILFSEFENEDCENIIAETLADSAPLPQELLERKEIAQILGSAMSRLPQKYRTVLFLRYNDHFTFREIAEALEEPLHTVKSRHRRAILIFKRLLQ